MYLEMLFSEIINIFTLFKSDWELKRGVLEERPAMYKCSHQKQVAELHAHALFPEGGNSKCLHRVAGQFLLPFVLL